MRCINRLCSPLKRNDVVTRGLDIRLRAKRAKDCLKWGSIHLVILALLLFDISNKCRFATSKWYYLEYALAVMSGLSAATYFCKYLLYLLRTVSVQGSKAQKNLLKFDDNDSSFITTTLASQKKVSNAKTKKIHPVNTSILSWHSSFNDSFTACGIRRSPNSSPENQSSRRQSLSPRRETSMSHNASNPWKSPTKKNSSMNASNVSSTVSLVPPYLKYTRDEIITDEQSLRKYLKNVSKRDFNETRSFNQSVNTRTMKSFWNYWNTAANLLKTSLYQLAPSTASSQNKQCSNDEGGLNIMNRNSEVIKKISSEKLSQYVANLRRWITITILQPLAKEICNVDESFKKRGIPDMQIGCIGLERLKKTLENQQFVKQYVPTLPLIVPFLDMASNQEYLVQRIKDLAKSSCIMDYRWDSGSFYHGLKWDEHLPTDSAILFHLFCVYLDSQLMPLPQGDGGRPFYNRYVISGVEQKSTKETLAEIHNKAHCAILCTDTLKPKFNFISDKKVHTCAYNRNNLFYVIIQFLIYMKTHHEAALEGVSLGPSGINIMCVIEDLLLLL